MKPSKTSYPTKKRPAKRKNSPMVQKLLELKYRINSHYEKTGIDSEKDKLWVMGQISALREGARLDRHQMKYANQLWIKYN